MNLIETEMQLKKILDGKVEKEDLHLAGTIVFELMSKFLFDVIDVYTILYSYPEILTKNPFLIVNNIDLINKHLCLTDIELKYLILKMPYLLLLDAEVLMFKLKLIAITYGCSIKDSLKLLYEVPELMFISKDFVRHQNEIFAKQLNQYGLKYRTVLRDDPKLLFVNENQIKGCKKCLMHDYSLSEEESQNVLVSSPSLIVGGETVLKKKFNVLYPAFFIKRDLKEILNYCPEFLLLSEQKIINEINNMKNTFKMKEKNVCDFLRLEPRCMFFDSVESRVKKFIKYNINLNYILAAPKLSMSLEISIPLKFLISRVLYLDDRFNEVCLFDSNLFISRFLFMQAYGYFNHQDLLETEENFYNIYHISSRVLLLSYTLNTSTLNNICLYYINSKDKIRGWSDIVFPEFNEILEFVNGDLGFNNFQDSSYLVFREENLFTKRQYDLYVYLKKLGFSIDEIKFVFNKNKSLNMFYGINCDKIIFELRKYNFTKEKIMKLLMTKQHLFNYNIRDFVLLTSEIAKEENCLESEVVEKYL